MAEEIKPQEVYTTEQAQDYLKVSKSTMKRFLKNGTIRANKVGKRYKILGRELLRLVSPKAELAGEQIYLKIKNKVKKTIEKW